MTFFVSLTILVYHFLLFPLSHLHSFPVYVEYAHTPLVLLPVYVLQ